MTFDPMDAPAEVRPPMTRKEASMVAKVLRKAARNKRANVERDQRESSRRIDYSVPLSAASRWDAMADRLESAANWSDPIASDPPPRVAETARQAFHHIPRGVR